MKQAELTEPTVASSCAVLVIEEGVDEGFVLHDLIRGTIGTDGCIWSATPRCAVLAATVQAPDVVLLASGAHSLRSDLLICEPLRRLRPAVRIILVAPALSEDDYREAFRCGVDHFLVLPVDARDLAAAIARVREPR